jgi:hypothetical protein
MYEIRAARRWTTPVLHVLELAGSYIHSKYTRVLLEHMQPLIHAHVHVMCARERQINV